MFHELGHCFHDLVSKTQYSRFHGPDGVPVDFGEMPSQMLEYWCWILSPLKSISSHYSYYSPQMLEIWKQQNPEKEQPERGIPDELIETLLKTRRVIFGPLFQLEQLHRSQFDMAIHQLSCDEDLESLDLTVLWNKSRKEIGLIDGFEVFDGNYCQGHSYSTFTHLMLNDYAAGYYTYL